MEFGAVINTPSAPPGTLGRAALDQQHRKIVRPSLDTALMAVEDINGFYLSAHHGIGGVTAYDREAFLNELEHAGLIGYSKVSGEPKPHLYFDSGRRRPW